MYVLNETTSQETLNERIQTADVERYELKEI